MSNSPRVNIVGESYFKRGARISREIRVALTQAVKAAPVNDRAEAYQIAISNLHKPWARRWLKANGYFR